MRLRLPGPGRGGPGRGGGGGWNASEQQEEFKFWDTFLLHQMGFYNPELQFISVIISPRMCEDPNLLLTEAPCSALRSVFWGRDRCDAPSVSQNLWGKTRP